MVRKKLEKIVGRLSDSEFAVICQMTTDDLMFNRVNFKKFTNLNYVVDIAVKCSEVFKICA